MTWVLVALAGGAGAVSRYLVDQRVGAWTGARRARRIRRTHLEIPWGTMVVNVSACLLIGLVAALTAGETYRVLATGFLGGYSTFSTACVEGAQLFMAGRTRAGCAHTLLMVGVSWLAACAGLALGGLAA
jgi:CrcB-like protein